VIDMRVQQKYSFLLNERHSFRIFFGDSFKISTDDIILTQPYPNPASEGISNFILGLPDTGSSYQVDIQIFNSTGVPINSEIKNLPTGIHQLKWQATENVLPGLYIYRVTVSDGNGKFISNGKIIIP
jgi:hypothetical protein